MADLDQVNFFALTDVGRKRKHNEDNFLVDKDLGLFVVADGMGGHAAGEVASAMAVHVVHEIVSARRDLIEDKAQNGPHSEVSVKQVLGLLEFAVQSASERIHAEAQSDSKKRGMGTTVSLLLIIDSYGYVAHVGDSRIYLERNGSVHQVTEDHTVANELLRLGMVTAEQLDKVPRKNAITRAVGVYQHVEVDTLTLEVLPGDQFMICSDGLAGYFDDSDEDMVKHLSGSDGEEVVQGLIDFANQGGGKDNITCVLVRLGSGDLSDSTRAKRLALKREVLTGMPLFARLNERELLRVMQAAEVYQYDTGETVMTQGERGDRMFVTLTGRLKVTRGAAVLNELGPGDHLGEMALIRSSTRSATVEALEPSELISLKRRDFFEIIRTEPHVAVKLLWQFLGVLADRLERTSRELMSTAREELAEDISSMVEEESVDTADDPFSQPVPAALGRFRLGFGAPLTPGGSSPPPPPAAEEYEIDDSPSFDDAPELAQKVDEPPAPVESGPHTARRNDPAAALAGDAIDDPPAMDAAPPMADRFEAPVTEEPRTPETAPGRHPSVPGRLDEAKMSERLAEIQAEHGDEKFNARETRPGARKRRKSLPFDAKKTLVAPGTKHGRRRQTTLASAQSPLSAGPEAPVSVAVEDGKVTGDTEPPPDDALPVDDAKATLPFAAARRRTTVKDKKDDFRPTHVTMPLDAPDSLRSELDVLRKEFQERLRKSRAKRDK